jgi:hypothetical protein
LCSSEALTLSKDAVSISCSISFTDESSDINFFPLSACRCKEQSMLISATKFTYAAHKFSDGTMIVQHVLTSFFLWMWGRVMLERAAMNMSQFLLYSSLLPLDDSR